jgi:ribosomal protein S18 acetylase RimI-like enzyme
MFILRKDNWFFNLTTPDYEVFNFGYKVGELRLTNDKSYSWEMDNIEDYLFSNKIPVCTFRGNEEIDIVRYLNSLGFLFVGTYSEVFCRSRNFNEIKVTNDLKIIKATKENYQEMEKIQSTVFDYSSYQLDSMFSHSVTSKRNVKRLSSYFDNPDHIAYVSIYNNKVIGYLQFIIDGDIAHCVNGAVDPSFHGLFIGVQLYSQSFKNIFDLGIDKITSDYCNQNIVVAKMHQAFNFKLSHHEIHLRVKL